MRFEFFIGGQLVLANSPTTLKMYMVHVLLSATYEVSTISKSS